MIVRIDTTSPVPPYRQLADQVLAMVANGQLRVDQRLPTVRQLAADLGLANGTVARAYRALEEAGVLETRGRRGTFVAKRREDLSEDQRLEYLREKMNEIIQAAATVGASEEDLRRALARGLEDSPLTSS